MLCISKKQAEYLRKNIADVVIVKTCKQNSKRGKRYVEETRLVLRLLDDYNNLFATIS